MGASTATTSYELLSPGRLLPHLERATYARPGAGRSGWSSILHLEGDLRRELGAAIPRRALETALRVLAERGRVRLWAGPDGVLWCCPVGVAGIACSPMA